MVGPLKKGRELIKKGIHTLVKRGKRVKVKPNRYYYHRGKGKWSEYSRARDAKKRGRGDAKVGKGPYRHTHDWVKPGKVIFGGIRMPESMMNILQEEKRRGNKYWEERWGTDLMDPHEIDHSLGRWERKRDWSEKWRDYIEW